MRSRLILIFGLTVALTQNLAAFNPTSLKDCRLAFLLGLSTGNQGTKWEIFWGSERENYCGKLFEAVGRAYVKDLGATEEELTTEAWRAKTNSELDACRDPKKRTVAILNDSLAEGFGPDVWSRIDITSAFVAGAYARYGTATGFRMTNHPTGTYLVIVIQTFTRLGIDFAIRPGYPGGLTITLSGGGKDELADFFAALKIIREMIAAGK